MRRITCVNQPEFTERALAGAEADIERDVAVGNAIADELLGRGPGEGKDGSDDGAHAFTLRTGCSR